MLHVQIALRRTSAAVDTKPLPRTRGLRRCPQQSHMVLQLLRPPGRTRAPSPQSRKPADAVPVVVPTDPQLLLTGVRLGQDFKSQNPHARSTWKPRLAFLPETYSTPWYSFRSQALRREKKYKLDGNEKRWLRLLEVKPRLRGLDFRLPTPPSARARAVVVGSGRASGSSGLWVHLCERFCGRRALHVSIGAEPLCDRGRRRRAPLRFLFF